MKSFGSLLILLGIVSLVSGQTYYDKLPESFNDFPRGEDAIRVSFYNVENLFDTYDDSLKRDEDFTPKGNHYWNNYRFYDKLNKLSKVVMAVGGWEPVEIAGFCELENRYVLEQLLSETPLSKNNYDIVHFESPDRRGIDVGLIYRAEKVELLSSKPIPITFPWDSAYKTRDILYAQFKVLEKDTLHLFINHWPSRWRGHLETQPARMHVARVLKQEVDRIQSEDPSARILIMGDFNDQPVDKSMKEVLNAKLDTTNLDSTDLVNMMFDKLENQGTHKYQSEWAVLDQVVVSAPMLTKSKGLVVRNKQAQIFSAPFLIERDEKHGGTKVYRTYIGMKYHGGYSDHLPVFIDLKVF
ncbi:endonuclease [bacterium SCSIO 12741]|nr:endonuclease [bacterium SCSIO 12741]